MFLLIVVLDLLFKVAVLHKTIFQSSPNPPITDRDPVATNQHDGYFIMISHWILALYGPQQRYVSMTESTNSSSFHLSSYNSPIELVLRLLFSCVLEQIVYLLIFSIVFVLFPSTRHSFLQLMEKIPNKILLSLLLPQLVKAVAIVIQIFDSDPSLLFILGLFMTSMQCYSFHCLINSYLVLPYSAPSVVLTSSSSSSHLYGYHPIGLRLQQSVSWIWRVFYSIPYRWIFSQVTLSHKPKRFIAYALMCSMLVKIGLRLYFFSVEEVITMGVNS